MIFDCMIDLPLTDGIVEWFVYTDTEIIYEKFSQDNWNFIFSDVRSNRGLANFFADNSIECYILSCHKDKKTIGFIFLLRQHSDNKIVSIHGGGWGDTPFLYYRGYLLMIEHLLLQGVRVRTYCDVTNERVLRFNQSIGFVNYRKTNCKIYLWINLNRLQKSKIYKRFVKNQF